MPRRKPGTWEGAPKYRWTQMVDGIRYRVSCAELGLRETDWTQERSMMAAAEAMQAKLAAAKPPAPKLDPVNQQIADILAATPPSELEHLAEQGKQAARLLDILRAASVANAPPMQSLPKQDDPFGPVGIATMPNPDSVKLPIPASVITQVEKKRYPDHDDDMNEHVVFEMSQVLKKEPVETNFSLRHFADKMLAKERDAATKGTTYSELDRSLSIWIDLLGDIDARTINEDKIEAAYGKLQGLPWEGLTKRKVWRIFRRFVKYLFVMRVIDMPRNLMEKFKFIIVDKKIKRYTAAEVREEFDNLPDRLRLYALLSLNCGMLGVDIATMQWAELDQEKWRIKRKRTKTKDHKDVPEVDYKLWPETAKLLKKHLSEHETFVLTSKTNTPLWECWIDKKTGKTKKKDLIVLQWKRRKKHKIMLKEFRSIGSTIISDHELYGRYAHHYLGHSPKSIADKHYTPPSDELFDKILDYVGQQLGLA